MNLLTLVWSTQARRDLIAIYKYSAQDSEQSALSVITRIQQRMERMAAFPNSGRFGFQPDTREAVISGLPYIVRFRVENRNLRIITIRHGAQRLKEGTH